MARSSLHAVVLLLLFSSRGIAQETRVPRFEEVEPGGIFPVTLAESLRATVGYLIVPENRERSNSAEIRLPVAIVHAAAPESEGPPVLYIAGGPGISGLSAAAFPGAYPWTRNRDFIVFGQRGTQHAFPALLCPEYGTALQETAFADDRADATRIRASAADACRVRLIDQGVDLNGYHTAGTAADIADLAEVLNVERLSLYAVSYGTRVALSVARDYPSILESMVLDSPLPPNARYDDESARNLEAAIAALIADCAATPACRSEYPDLSPEWRAAVESAGSGDRALTVALDTSGAAVSLSFADQVALLSPGSEEGIRRAPGLLAAIIEGDSAVIADAVAKSLGPSSFAWGMRLSVWCSESSPYSERASMPAPAPVLGGFESAVVAPEVCDAWGVEMRPAREVAPVSARIPTLIIAGAFDPYTPPAWAYLAAETLSRSAVAVIPRAGHTPTQQWSGTGCAMGLASAFLEVPIEFLGDEQAAKRCTELEPPVDYEGRK